MVAGAQEEVIAGDQEEMIAGAGSHLHYDVEAHFLRVGLPGPQTNYAVCDGKGWAGFVFAI